ncbi:AAA family ATPase [Mariniblastus sp.]|nr:AAA family ATPase [Mariniblastus sp.]
MNELSSAKEDDSSELRSLPNLALELYVKANDFRQKLEEGKDFRLPQNLQKELRKIKKLKPEIIFLSDSHAILKSDLHYHCDHSCFAFAALSCNLYEALGQYYYKTLEILDWKKNELTSNNIEAKKSEIVSTLDSHLAQSKASELRRFIFKESFKDTEFERAIDVNKKIIPHKGLDRFDWFYPTILTACGLITDSSSAVALLAESLSKYSEITDGIKEAIDQWIKAVPPEINGTTGGSNRIFFGPPGTGKSYAINSRYPEANQIRTVFHSETQYSDFVGSLRPVMKTIASNNSDSEASDNENQPLLNYNSSSPSEVSSKQVAYEFRAGPFTRALIMALNEPDKHHVLVIEEINRASAASAIGEIFQLLDRDESGRSTTSIQLADPDMLSYIKDELDDPEILDDRVYIPGNLSLIATMNSGDQMVQPLDTAFKRRWTPEYFPIDFEKLDNVDGYDTKKIEVGGIKINWRQFAEQVNKELNENIAEDRHLAPFFLTADEFKSDEFNGIFFGKVLVYLWDDVLKYHESEREKIFDAEIKSIGDLLKRHREKPNRVYASNFINKFTIDENDE